MGESWLLKVLVFLFFFFNLTHYPLGKNYQNQLSCPVNSDSSSGCGCTYSIESDLSSREFSPTPVLTTPTGGSDFVSRVFFLSFDPRNLMENFI